MRLANGPWVECEIEVAAGPERVWRLVSDISTSARFSPELWEVEWLDGAEEPGPLEEVAEGVREPGATRPASGEARDEGLEVLKSLW